MKNIKPSKDDLHFKNMPWDYMVFRRFESFGSEHCSKVYDLSKGKMNEFLEDFFEQRKSKKENPVFTFNYFYEVATTRKDVDVEVPICHFIDIDFKKVVNKKEVVDINKVNQFKIDQGFKEADDFEMVKNMFLDKLHGDRAIFVATKSSGIGLRIIMSVCGGFWYSDKKRSGFEFPPFLDPEKDAVTQNKIIHTSNCYYAMKYLVKYGLKMGSYIDPSSFNNMVQVSFSCRKDSHTYINREPVALVNIIDEENYSEAVNNRIDLQITDEQSEFNQKDNIEYFNEIKDEYIEGLIEPLIQRYNYPFLLVIKSLNIDGRKHFYQIFTRKYRGDSVQIGSFEKFNSYLNKLDGKYYLSLRNFLYNLGFILKERKCDVFGYPYDEVIEYEEHISEVGGRIRSILTDKEKNKRVIINAPAGAGKTTFLFKYLKSKYEEGKRVCIAAPKRPILNQCFEKWGNEVNFIRNYTNEKSQRLNQQDKARIPDRQNYFYLSTLNSLRLIEEEIDILVIDEVHDLVDLAQLHGDKQIAWDKVDKTGSVILVSATPEKFLIGGTEKYYYLNFIPKNYVKPKARILFSHITLNVVIGELKNNDEAILIYYNDIKKGKQIKELLTTLGIEDVYLINSETKGSPVFQRLLKEEILTAGKYICTDLVNEGINILNKDWDKLIMVDNYTSDFFGMYQMVNRFRHAEGLQVLILCNPIHMDKKEPIDHLQPYKVGKYLDDLYSKEKNYCADVIKAIEEERYVKERIDQILGEKFVYLDSDDKYKINKNQLKANIYRTNFYDKMRRNRLLYLQYLHHFFDFNMNYYNGSITPYKFEEDNLFQQYETEITEYFDTSESYFYNTYISNGLFDEENKEYADLLVNIKEKQAEYRKYYNRIVKCRELSLDQSKIYLSDESWQKEVGLIGIQMVEDSPDTVQKVDYHILQIKKEVENAFKITEQNGWAATEDIFSNLSDETKKYFKGSHLSLGKKIPYLFRKWKSDRRQIKKRKCAGWRQD